MMKNIKNVRLVKQAISVVLLFGFACVASGAEQMMRALPAPATPQLMPAPAVVEPSRQTKQAPPKQAGGMARITPAGACGMNPAPRITSINGRSSAGIEFKPGDKLDIAGCGFGSEGRRDTPAAAELVGAGQQIPLIIDTWNNAHIVAHIDAGKTGIPDLDGIKLKVWPYGAPILSDMAHKFRAARETVHVALPPKTRRIFSNIYGPNQSIALSNSPDGRSTIVERNSEQNMGRKIYIGFCPAVTNQQAQMKDELVIDGGMQSLLHDGFVVASVDYQNQTQQENSDDSTWQKVVVGSHGGALYIQDLTQDRIVVTFQGHSTYVKKMVFSDEGGISLCTSRYTVSLSLSGPRGVKPFK